MLVNIIISSYYRILDPDACITGGCQDRKRWGGSCLDCKVVPPAAILNHVGGTPRPKTGALGSPRENVVQGLVVCNSLDGFAKRLLCTVSHEVSFERGGSGLLRK